MTKELGVRVDPKNVHEVLDRHMLADGFSIVFDHRASRGVNVVDSRSGKTFLDLFGFFASAPVGANHPGLANPEFIEKMGRVAIHNPTNSDIYTTEMAEFVETFARFATEDGLKHLFFIAGGGLAVENAMKTAMDWKVRKNIAAGLPREKGRKVLHFREAFHGRTGYTLSVTNTSSEIKHKYFAKLDWPRITNPKVTFPLTGENLERAIAAEEKAVREIEAAFEANPDDICAILIEPIQGEGGDNHFRPEFHQALRRLADERDALLIYDEVQSGFGGTGKMWAYQHYGVVPDIVAFGKKTQVCGIMVGPRVDQVDENVFNVSSRLNSTWGGNLSDMVRCTRYMEIIEEENLVENCAAMGEILQAGLHELAGRRPELVSNVRGKGLFCAFDLPTAEQRDALLGRIFENGALVVGCGERSVRFRPPLDIDEAAVRKGLDIVARSVEEIIK